MTRDAQINTEMTIGQALRLTASRASRREAVISDGKRVTYGELLDRVLSLAYSLRELGLGPGDRVATLLWPGVDLVYLFFAAAELGAVLAPLPPRLRRSQMEDFLRELKPALVVTCSDLEVEDGINVLRALQVEMPCIKRVIVAGLSQQDEPQFSDMVTASYDDVAASVGPRDLLAILYTSGTTGRGKGVMHSHRSLIAPVVASIGLRQAWMRFPSLGNLGRWLRPLARYGMKLLWAVGRQQVFLSTIPMHTIAGLESMLQALLMGDRLVTMSHFHPLKALDIIGRERVTVLIAVPAAYVTMMRSRGFDSYKLSSLLICGTGAAPCPPELAREIQRRFKCAVHIGFGLTESGGGISATGLEDSFVAQTETVGQPMPGVEVRIVDDDRRPLSPGAIGELVCRSDGVMVGYFGGSHDVGSVVDEDGWLYTGDLAAIDEDGYIRIVGRKKDMIIRGGQNIHPSKIEDLIAAMSSVHEAAVVGVPDTLGGEAVWAFAVREDGSAVTEGEVLERCRAGLEPYEVPQHVRFVADLPRTSNNKVQKYILRERAVKEAGDDD